MNCVNKCDFGTKCFAKVEHFVLRLIILARENGIQSIAFPCISTGVYHYPKEEAARIALNAIGEEMAHGYEGEVIVCCFSEKDAEVYRKLLSC